MRLNFKLIKGPALTLAILFIFVGTLTTAMVYFSYSRVKEVKKDGYIYIATGTDFDQRAAILIDSGFIQDSSMFKRFARNLGFRKVYPGKYELKKDMTYKELLSVIGRGLQSPINVTFNNIRDFEKLSSVVSRYIEADSLSLYAALSSDTMATHYGLTKATFLGMFIPNTYQMYWNSSAEDFIARMNKEYKRFWSNEKRQEALEKLGYTPEQVTALASIVYEETKRTDEMPIVAGVYVNRLKAGIPLQADPTVKFALGDPTIRRVLLRHLEVDSPYNTYKHAGLPPGLISIPSVAAIDAVLNYKEHNYYYFCASPALDGTHRFASNLSQHNRNAAEYASALNRMKIYK